MLKNFQIPDGIIFLHYNSLSLVYRSPNSSRQEFALQRLISSTM